MIKPPSTLRGKAIPDHYLKSSNSNYRSKFIPLHDHSISFPSSRIFTIDVSNID